jgi:hypothetical protein
VHRGAARLVGSQHPPAHRRAAGVRDGAACARPDRPMAGSAGRDGPVHPDRLRSRGGHRALHDGERGCPKAPGVRRTAELRFGHPFAVVAAGNANPPDSHRPDWPSPWHGLPVFSAWVADPEDATAEPNGTS